MITELTIIKTTIEKIIESESNFLATFPHIVVSKEQEKLFNSVISLHETLLSKHNKILELIKKMEHV